MAPVMAGEIVGDIVGDCVIPESRVPPSIAFARPKSSTFTCPFSVSFTFSGFRSRWTIPCSCATSSAWAICVAILNASSIGMRPDLMRSASVGPSTSSSTRACTPESPSSSSPKICPMCGWLSEARTCASRWNRAMRSAFSAKVGGRTFSATLRRSFVSAAR